MVKQQIWCVLQHTPYNSKPAAASVQGRGTLCAVTWARTHPTIMDPHLGNQHCSRPCTCCHACRTTASNRHPDAPASAMWVPYATAVAASLLDEPRLLLTCAT